MYTILFYLINILYKAAMILFQLLPYLVVGTIIGESLRYVHIDRAVKKLNSCPYEVSIFLAAVIGMLSPLCTFGTVPVVLQLKNSGVKLPVLIIFLISSSMMNPQLFIITWGGISLLMTMIRVLSILIFVFMLGMCLKFIPDKFIVNKKWDIKSENPCKIRKKDMFKWKDYIVNVFKSMEYTGFYLVIGVIIAAGIEVMVPGSFSNAVFRQNKIVQILIMATLSIPFYTCGGGITPIIKSFISSGMSNGTALAFLNVGSATRVTTIMALATIIRPIILFIYVLILVVYSVIVGYIFI